MADAPQHNPVDYSTLEAVQHHPELVAKNDVELSNGVYGKERFSTLESAPNSPDPGVAKGEHRYSTLETYHDPNNEKTGAGLGLSSVAESSEMPPKENWKRRRVCGVPLLFLLIGLVVLGAVIAAVVGGVVGWKSKSNSSEPTQQQSGSQPSGDQSSADQLKTVTATQTLVIVGGNTVSTQFSSATEVATSTPTSSPSDNSPQKTWITEGVRRYAIGGYNNYYLSDEGTEDCGLKEPGTFMEDSFKFLVEKVREEDQAIYDNTYPWGSEGKAIAYNILPLRKGVYLSLDPTVDSIAASEGSTKEIAIKLLPLSSTDTNPSLRAWFFRSLNTSEALAGNEIPWSIHSIAFKLEWRLGINTKNKWAPQLQIGDEGQPGEKIWTMDEPTG